MAVIGTFGSFTAARLGIYASQSSLNVTGNNIANIKIHCMIHLFSLRLFTFVQIRKVRDNFALPFIQRNA